MKTKSIYLLLLATFCCLRGAYAQTASEPAIRMRAEVSDEQVLLRWAPTHEKAWLLLNKYGVRLERHTLVSQGEVLKEPLRVVLAECLKPEASEAFKEMAGTYAYGAIIAQAVFGERFEVSGSGAYDVATVMALGQELQQRYVFSLYAADLCFPAAVVAGWGWRDTTAAKNGRYLYRVIPLVPAAELSIQEGGLLVERDRKERLPKALDFQGRFADGHVLLSWNFRTLESLYNAYMPERSTDGINFSPISDTPITRMESTSAPDEGQIHFVDSISNDTTYYYRIAGLTPFGSRGAYSDTISGRGAVELKESPCITKAIPNQQGGADIEWSFSQANEPFIHSFMVEYSPDGKENYSELQVGIDKRKRQIQLQEIGSSNYYVVTAVTTTGKKLRSFAALVQAIDTIPPAAPVGLVAIADSTGAVRLSWQANREPDIYGYRLYRGQTADEELIPLNDLAIQGTQFIDSLNLNLMNSTAYYAITALDERYNQSPQSPVIELRKPEKVPPTPPFITEVKITNGKNSICWVSGGEPTLAGYDVYKRTGQEEAFLLLSTIQGDTVTTCEDLEVENNQWYTYRVQSRTVGGLRSDPSPDYRVQAIHKVAGSNLTAELTLTSIKGSIRIRWKTEATDVVATQLYKKRGAEQPTLFREGTNQSGEIDDRLVAVGESYQYILVIKTNRATPITITKEIRL